MLKCILIVYLIGLFYLTFNQNKVSDHKAFRLAWKRFALIPIFYCAFSILAILIASIGLFTLSVLSLNQRTKEIGIRKVNGATNVEILAMLNKDFLKLILIAFIIATPIAWYAMHRWLENFANKTNQSWWIFALIGILTMVISVITVSWKSRQVTRNNPVEALRYE